MQTIILYLLSIISHKFVLVENYFLLYNLYHDPHFSSYFEIYYPHFSSYFENRQSSYFEIYYWPNFLHSVVPD